MKKDDVFDIIKKRRELKKLINLSDKNIEHSFIYMFLYRFPSRVKVIDYMVDILGEVPSWNNMSDYLFDRLYESLVQEEYQMKSIQHFFYSIKKTIKEAYEEGIISQLPSKHLSTILPIKGIVKSNNDLFFSDREVGMIHNFQPKTECEKYTKKIFMLMCLCGCSYEDAIELTPDNISNGHIYYIKDNGVEVSVPMHRWIEEYLYQSFEKKYTRVYMRRTLRTLIRRVFANDDFIFKDGSVSHKYCIVKFNTALKTFATLLYRNGVKVETIQSYMGILQKSSMYYYIVDYEGPRKRIWNRKKADRIPI